MKISFLLLNSIRFKNSRKGSFPYSQLCDCFRDIKRREAARQYFRDLQFDKRNFAGRRKQKVFEMNANSNNQIFIVDVGAGLSQPVNAALAGNVRRRIKVNIGRSKSDFDPNHEHFVLKKHERGK